MESILPGGLQRRLILPEVMDDPGLESEALEGALRGLRRINWISRTSTRILGEISANFRIEGPLKVLDIACGGGDVAVALERAAIRRQLDLRVDGCDRSERSLELARKLADRTRVSSRFFQHNVTEETLPAGYDVIISSLFLHHLDRTDAVQLLREKSRAARHGFIVSDLERRRIGYLLALLASRTLSRSEVVRTDSLRSVRAAFSEEEVLSLTEDAKLRGCTLSRCWPCRFLLTWRNI